MRKIIAVLFIVVGIIHLLPVSGVLGSERLAMLYGVSFDGTELSILMRHRAVMFGLFGLLFIYAAIKPAIQPLAFIAGFVSVVSFILLAWSTEGYNNAIEKVVLADIIALICLVIALTLYKLNKDKI